MFGSKSRKQIPLVCTLFLCLLFGCHSEKEDISSQKETTVQVLTVEPRDVPVTFSYIANIESSRLVNIQARVSGFLEKRVYTEGEMVEEGQILFLMDKKPFLAQVAAAEAAVDKKKAAKETARLNLARTKPLAALNALSQKDLDDATGEYESAAAAVDEAQAQLETALLNLSYCTIRSPLFGITSAALQQDGAYINVQNSKLTTVAALNPIWVNFSLSENQMQDYLDKVKKGVIIPPANEEYEVDVILVDGSLFPHKGKITFTAPYYNSSTGTFLIRVMVENPKGVLRPNQYVHVRIKGAIRPHAIAIPQRAVQQSAKGHYVWTVNAKSEVEYQPVSVGDWEGENWFINQGLQAGDRVVVDGGMTLQSGKKVLVKQLDAKEAAEKEGQRKNISEKTVMAKS